MKTIYKLLSFALLLPCMISCEKDSEFDDVYQSMVTTSFGGQSNIIQIDDVMSFIDISRGLKSRTWTFPNGITFDESGNEISTSTDELVKVSFSTPGTYYVNIKQEFYDNYYVNSGFIEGTTYEEDIEVIVRDIVQASYTAINSTEGGALQITDDAMNQVEAGHTVTFTSTSTGVPSTIKWTISRDDGFSDSVSGDATTGEAEYKFSIPGIYNITMLASSDLGTSTISNKKVIEIIASDDPVTLDCIERYSTNEIGLVMSRSMSDAASCDPTAFAVAITNGGVDVPCAITGVSSTDNIVRIMLDTEIYNSDIITVNYDSTIGNLCTLDNVKVESFTDLQLTDFKVVDLLGAAGFDTSFENSAASDWVYLWWGAPWDQYTIEISSVQAYSGDKSTHLNMPGMGGAIIEYRAGGTEIFFDVEANTQYAVGFWSYVTTKTEAEDYPSGAFDPDIRANLSTDNSWGYSAAFDGTTPLNEWVYRTIIVSTGTTGATKLQFRGANNTLPNEFDIYIDDLTVTKYEAR